jgi:hypothetical protein
MVKGGGQKAAGRRQVGRNPARLEAGIARRLKIGKAVIEPAGNARL